MKIKLPVEVAKTIAALEDGGFDAYAVGGCVRDSLLGLAPQDWDVTTSATPDEMKTCFPSSRIIETGLKHGTLTVITGGMPVEITTFRIDGLYSDHRRPDEVSFTRDLRSDLSRRDFTVNAMAYHHEKGLVDCFGGMSDLAARRIACVGDAEKRFYEDALRILRAARFAATLRFDIETKTKNAMLRLCTLLDKISAERIAVELNKTLLGSHCAETLLENAGIFAQILPELRPTFGFEQRTKYHIFDVWRHTVEAVRAAPEDLILRLTMLLHDIGKPQTFTADKDGEGHFYGHAAVSARMAAEALSRLKYDNATKNAVEYLIAHHCDAIPVESGPFRRFLGKAGEERLRQLIEVKRADCRAKAPEFTEKRETALDAALSTLDKIIAEKQAFCLRDLAVNGKDLTELGFREGKELGNALQKLLELVMDETAPNERGVLLAEAARILKK